MHPADIVFISFVDCFSAFFVNAFPTLRTRYLLCSIVTLEDFRITLEQAGKRRKWRGMDYLLFAPASFSPEYAQKKRDEEKYRRKEMDVRKEKRLLRGWWRKRGNKKAGRPGSIAKWKPVGLVSLAEPNSISFACERDPSNLLSCLPFVWILFLFFASGFAFSGTMATAL